MLSNPHLGEEKPPELPYPVIRTSSPCAVCSKEIQPGQLYIIETMSGRNEIVTHVHCKWPQED